jgi:hypothetical protein
MTTLFAMLGLSLGLWRPHGKAQSSTPSGPSGSQLDFSNSGNSQLLTIIGTTGV